MNAESDFFDGKEVHVFTVSDLTRQIRALIENSIGTVWVEGEVCNYRRQSSGHQYFTLKDDQCQISCVLFHRPSLRLRQIPLAEGMQVQVRGAVTVYEARGQYQMNVQLVHAAGAGLLQARFEALKKKLQTEGLFEPSRKKALPAFPRCIGIVSSTSGAALHDMLNILKRRAPWIRVMIHPVRVQGEGAADEIARAIIEFNCEESLKVDVIVVCRGGGSAEDLSQFNDENLARAISASSTPVVSAVGHEIDFTIADFVSDLRAPTPSAAAELITPDKPDLVRRIRTWENSMSRRIENELDRLKVRVEFTLRNAIFREPVNLISGVGQSVDLAEKGLNTAMASFVKDSEHQLQQISGKLREHRPDQRLEIQRHTIGRFAMCLTQHVNSRMQAAQHALERTGGLLHILAPETTLKRGFSITTDSSGRLLRSADSTTKGMEILTRLADGNLSSVVQ